MFLFSPLFWKKIIIIFYQYLTLGILKDLKHPPKFQSNNISPSTKIAWRNIQNTLDYVAFVMNELIHASHIDYHG